MPLVPHRDENNGAKRTAHKDVVHNVAGQPTWEVVALWHATQCQNKDGEHEPAANKYQSRGNLTLSLSQMRSSPTQKPICVLGVQYKKGTGT